MRKTWQLLWLNYLFFYELFRNRSHPETSVTFPTHMKYFGTIVIQHNVVVVLTKAIVMFH